MQLYSLRRFYTAYTQRWVNKRSTRSRVRRIHVDSLFAHDLHLLRWNARGVQSGRIKIEIKTGPVQIVSHSYELLDRSVYTRVYILARLHWPATFFKNRPIGLYPWIITGDRLIGLPSLSLLTRKNHLLPMLDKSYNEFFRGEDQRK